VNNKQRDVSRERSKRNRDVSRERREGNTRNESYLREDIKSRNNNVPPRE